MQVNDNKEFEPVIVAFCCNWCSYAGADLSAATPATVTIHQETTTHAAE